MQLNQAKFRLNGYCGYVLKPDYMLEENNSLTNNWMEETLSVTICIMAGRHVGRPGRNGISNPFVIVEVYGAEYDSGLKLNTRTISMFDHDDFILTFFCTTLVRGKAFRIIASTYPNLT